jgi:hypothetical protein
MTSRTNPQEILAGGGDMGARMRALDWSHTTVGPSSPCPRAWSRARSPPRRAPTHAPSLLTNAFKFMEGRPERRVEVTAREEGAGCVLTVRDTGPGISAAALPRIFEPFYRAPGAKASGHGIGLATVRRILKAHGGEVSAQSVVDQGTTFAVWMPHASRGAPIP